MLIYVGQLHKCKSKSGKEIAAELAQRHIFPTYAIISNANTALQKRKEVSFPLQSLFHVRWGVSNLAASIRRFLLIAAHFALRAFVLTSLAAMWMQEKTRAESDEKVLEHSYLWFFDLLLC